MQNTVDSTAFVQSENRVPGISLEAFEQCWAQERQFLFRLARSQLRDNHAAEDAVQETAIAAWQGLGRFEGRSSVRTWLVSILRFKILDGLRQRQRQPFALSELDMQHEMNQLVSDDLLFDAHGQWAELPQEWNEDRGVSGSPDEQLHQQQLLDMLQVCLDSVPEKTAQVFLMREYMGFEGEEIAQKTGLQAGHVRVILSRVRLTLRTCIDIKQSSLKR